MTPSNSIRLEKRYTVRETADALDVTPDTVKGYCRSGVLRAKKVGPKQAWSIQGTEIRRLLKAWNAD